MVTIKTWVESRKQVKRNHILDLIRRSDQPLSRFDIKKMTGYSMTTVSNSVMELIQSGLLIEEECVDSNRMGRKPVHLHLNPTGGYFIGVEFNIQAIHYVVMDFACHPLFVGHAEVPDKITTPLLLDLIYQHTQECLDFLGNRRDHVLGIGLGVPGYIDVNNGMALSSPYMSDWVNIPIVKLMEEKFNLPCQIANNIGVMGLVFKWINDYHVDGDFLLISIRSGVRCIPVLNQQPYSGRLSSTGEIGHLKLSEKNQLCDCGQRGCLNTEVSDFTLRNRMEEGIAQGRFSAVSKLAGGARPTVSMLVRAALDGDAESRELITHAGYYLGTAIAETANLFAPQKIILSGKLIKAGDLLFDVIKQRLDQNCLPAIREHLEIIPSPFGDSIGAMGAAALILEREFNPMASGTEI